MLAIVSSASGNDITSAYPTLISPPKPEWLVSLPSQLFPRTHDPPLEYVICVHRRNLCASGAPADQDLIVRTPRKIAQDRNIVNKFPLVSRIRFAPDVRFHTPLFPTSLSPALQRAMPFIGTAHATRLQGAATTAGTAERGPP